MKKILITLLLVSIVSTAQAQNSEKAKELLNQVSSKIENYDNIVIDFKYVLENKDENIRQETRGDVSMAEEKYVLNLMGATRMFDGKKMYTINPEDEEINISNYNPKDDNAITPSKMLTFYNDGYSYKWDKKENLKGRTIQYIKLTPNNSNTDIKNILLGIDPQTKHIYNLIQTQENGTTITITVNSFKTNQPLSKTLFVFNKDKYEDYYINRL